jgi:dTDP-4-dehydrorhamnose 3,5-epimerase
MKQQAVMGSRFSQIKTPLEGLLVLQCNPLGDKRGYLERLFCQQELQPILKGKQIKQINHTFTEIKGTVRGAHFQYPPYTEMKFVSCIRGEVFDVAIDIRKGSPTYLHYHAETLTEENHKILVIPEGFAHGFQTLTQNCEMLYFHTNEYAPEAEGALNATDPALNIKWQLDIQEMSDRDRNHPIVAEGFEGVQL